MAPEMPGVAGQVIQWPQAYGHCRGIDVGRCAMGAGGIRAEQMDPADVVWLHMDRPTNLMVVNTVLWFDLRKLGFGLTVGRNLLQGPLVPGKQRDWTRPVPVEAVNRGRSGGATVNDLMLTAITSALGATCSSTTRWQKR